MWRYYHYVKLPSLCEAIISMSHSHLVDIKAIFLAAMNGGGMHLKTTRLSVTDSRVRIIDYERNPASVILKLLQIGKIGWKHHFNE